MAILLTIMAFAVIVLLANVGSLLKDHAETRKRVDEHDAALRAVHANVLNLIDTVREERKRVTQLEELVTNLFDTIEK